MTGRRLADVVDRAVEDILDRRTSLEAALEDHPELRDELEPLLRAALALHRAQPRLVAPDPARRTAFMAALRETPQVAPRRAALRAPAWPPFRLPSWRGFSLGMAGLAAPAAVVVVMVLALSLLGGGASTASAATLTVFGGHVERLAGDAWQAADDGAGLGAGDTIRTTADGRALVTFADGSTASLGPDTEITLARVVLGEMRDIEIAQASGGLWNDVVNRPSDAATTYLVRTPHALVEAQGTVFQTVVDADTAVAAAEGRVRVIAAEERIELERGQRVLATAESLGAPVAAPTVGEIEVRAPMAAGVSTSLGIATGVLPTGVTFHQIPGVTTTGVDDGPQQIFIGAIEPGVYSLWLRRFAEGAGVIAIDTTTDHVEVPVPADVTTGRISIAIDIVDGDVFMRVLETELEAEVAGPEVRVVPSARTRSAVELRVAVEAREPEARASNVRTPSPPPPTAAPTVPAWAQAPLDGDERRREDARSDDGRGRDRDDGDREDGRNDRDGADRRDDDRDGRDDRDEEDRRDDDRDDRDSDDGRGRDRDAAPLPALAPTPEATPTEAPRGSRGGDDDDRDRDRDRDDDREGREREDGRGNDRNDDDRDAEDDRRDRGRGDDDGRNRGGGDDTRNRAPSWEQRFEAAVAAAVAGDSGGLAAVLEETLAGNRRTDEQRLEVVVDALRNPAARAAILAALYSGIAPDVLEALPERLERGSRDLRALGETIANELAADEVDARDEDERTPERGDRDRADDRREDDRDDRNRGRRGRD